MRAVELIERKRDGGEHQPGELTWLIEGYAAGRVAPEQMSAWAMAVVWRGLSDAETHELTQAMVDSGATIDLSALGRTVVDKHSTGGVGDKTTIALAPLAAAMGMPVAKLSGRGLAHTGGTLDKLESIPGFRVALSVAELIEQVARIGAAVAAQSDDLVPADRLLYALRDVTGTVPSPGLIAASVMSKKLAAGADAILLDVKVGEGAFMPDLESARELAVRMRDIGLRAGRPTVCELTAMDSPLGSAVGNALEVAESCELLAGGGPADFRELVVGSAARMAVLSDLGVDLENGRRLAEEAIASGAGLRAFEQLVEAQGGDPRLAEEPWSVLEAAPVVLAVPAPRAGAVARCGALAIGRAAMRLGPGASARRIRSITPSGSSRTPSRATRCLPVRRSQMSMRATAAAPSRAQPRRSPRTSSSTARLSDPRCSSRRSADARASRGRDGQAAARAAPGRPRTGGGRDPRPPVDRSRAAHGRLGAARRQAHQGARAARKVPGDRAGRRRGADGPPAYDRQPALASDATGGGAAVPRARALLDDGSYLGYTDVRRFGRGAWRRTASRCCLPALGPEPLDGWRQPTWHARSPAGRHR